jgi:hypothetical protein
LTGIQAHLTFQDPADLFDLLARPIEGPYLCGAQAEPVGGVVFAAVSHHEYFDVPRRIPWRLPVGLLHIAHEGPALAAPVLLELADKIPAIIAAPLAELFRRIPRIAEDKLGLTAQAIAGIAQ